MQNDELVTAILKQLGNKTPAPQTDVSLSLGLARSRKRT
jgi:hypothetical protein